MEYIFLIIMIGGTGFFVLYHYVELKRKQYLQDYQVEIIQEEEAKKKAKTELDAHIRAEQRNKSFYMDIILTHEDAIGVKSSSDNEGRRRTGILSIGDIPMVGKNSQGEDHFYYIEETGLELWATFEKDELILKSQKNAFEIRVEGTPRDKGTRTLKATIKEGYQYYLILDSRHEIGLLAARH